MTLCGQGSSVTRQLQFNHITCYTQLQALTSAIYHSPLLTTFFGVTRANFQAFTFMDHVFGAQGLLIFRFIQNVLCCSNLLATN